MPGSWGCCVSGLSSLQGMSTTGRLTESAGGAACDGFRHGMAPEDADNWDCTCQPTWHSKGGTQAQAHLTSMCNLRRACTGSLCSGSRACTPRGIADPASAAGTPVLQPLRCCLQITVDMVKVLHVDGPVMQQDWGAARLCCCYEKALQMLNTSQDQAWWDEMRAVRSCMF